MSFRIWKQKVLFIYLPSKCLQLQKWSPKNCKKILIFFLFKHLICFALSTIKLKKKFLDIPIFLCGSFFFFLLLCNGVFSLLSQNYPFTILILNKFFFFSDNMKSCTTDILHNSLILIFQHYKIYKNKKKWKCTWCLLDVSDF